MTTARLSKRQSLSITTVLSRTTFTRTIITQPPYEMTLGSNLSQFHSTVKGVKNNGKRLIAVLLIRNNDNKTPKKKKNNVITHKRTLQ